MILKTVREIIKAMDINFNDILLDKKPYKENYENIYDLSYKTQLVQNHWVLGIMK